MASTWVGTRLGTLAVLAAPGEAAVSPRPSIFDAHGPAASRVATLGWTSVVVATLVFVIVLGALAYALLRARPAATTGAPPATEGIHDHPNELRGVFAFGLALPALVLLAMYVYSTVDTAALAAPPRPTAETVVVEGRQWWWEVRYPGENVVTANEIHIPVGRPVRVVLRSRDVIHSFWVPQLAPKMDLVPGRTNATWIQADSAGTYLGECAEFCGPQHAHMAFTVVADPPAVFQQWVAAQRGGAAAPSDPSAVAGWQAFQNAGCGYCHAVRGTEAHGVVGPDLTHLASRQTLAAGTLRNTRGNLAGWIANAQTLKPGNRMPTVELNGRDLQAITAYLETLR